MKLPQAKQHIDYKMCGVKKERRFPLLLNIDLIPKPCWYKNVRSQVDPSTWFKLIGMVTSNADFHCQICGGQGKEWPVECHEVWHRKQSIDSLWIQRLIDLRAICSNCALVRHYGRAQITGQTKPALSHFMAVNYISERDALEHIQIAFGIWRVHNTRQWVIDLSYLDKLGVKYSPICA